MRFDPKRCYLGYASVVLFSSLWLSVSAYAQFDTTAATYTRYTRPGQCVTLGARLTSRYWRDKRVDTVRYAPETDSVPAVVRGAVRACAARFTLATTASRDLIDLLSAQLWLGQIDAARITEAKLVASESAHPAIERGWTLYRIFNAYLHSKPTQLADAARVLAQLDAMPISVAPWRVLAHTDMASYDLRVNAIVNAVAEGRTAVAANRSMERNDRVDRVGDAWEAWRSLAEATSIQASGPAALAALDTAAFDLLPLLAPPSIGAKLDSGQAQASLGHKITKERAPYEITGTTPPPLEATHWYTAHGDSTLEPMSHTVTLVMAVSPNCGGVCFSQYAVLRRLFDKYHSRGLRVVLLGKTQGAFKGHPMPQAALEASRIRQYVFDFLELPGTLGVFESTFSFIADGRRVNLVWPSEHAYIRGRSGAIVGKDGGVDVVADFGPLRERLLDAWLEAMLGRISPSSTH